MWRNPSNNYEEYFRDHRERDSEQWRNQTPMESFNQPPHESEVWTESLDQSFHTWTDSESFGNDAFYQQPPYFQHQNEDMEYEWNHQHHYEPSNEKMEYGWNHECQQELSKEEMWYMENYQCQQESYNSNLYYHDSSVEDHQEYENPGIISMLQQLLEGLERGEKKFEEAIERMENNVESASKGISERLDELALGYDSLKAKVEIQEASNDDEDMAQESGAWNVFPKEHYVVDEHQKDCRQQQCLYEDDEESIQFHEDALNEDVQDAQFPLKEEIEETPKDAEMTLEGEVVEIFFPYYEIVVEYQDDTINTQQQSPAEEEVEELIQLHEGSLDRDALALIVAVMNEETLRLNNASNNYATNKEEEEVVQLFELSQKELHQDEAVEPRVPGTPTPRLEHPQGPRKRLEWKIKHKWRIKPRNV